MYPPPPGDRRSLAGIQETPPSWLSHNPDGDVPSQMICPDESVAMQEILGDPAGRYCHDPNREEANAKTQKAATRPGWVEIGEECMGAASRKCLRCRRVTESRSASPLPHATFNQKATL